MRILILNWRDIKNPEHGGAEVLTHEMAKRWVTWGHEVTQFSASFPQSQQRQAIDGVQIVRSGSSMIRSFHLPVHVAAFLWYQANNHKFDIVIDEIHGIPFFSTLYVKIPVVALICEVAGDLWNKSFSWPTSRIGSFIERHYFRLYQKVPFMTISHSSREELKEKGISENRITVLPMGVTVPRAAHPRTKEKTPTLIYVGRLTKAKGIEDAIELIDRLKMTVPTIRLWAVGNGDSTYVSMIDDRVVKRGLSNHIHLYGFVSEEKKFDLMARAHILIAPSYKEGWGLTPIEAGSVGTPSVAYDVDGLRDSVIHNRSGLLSAPNVTELERTVLRLLRDPGLYKKLQTGAFARHKAFSWERSAKVALDVLASSV